MHFLLRDCDYLLNYGTFDNKAGSFANPIQGKRRKHIQTVEEALLGEVQQLIPDAIDPDRLCNMFPGWAAWPVIHQNFYYAGLNLPSPAFPCAMSDMLPAMTFVMAVLPRYIQALLAIANDQKSDRLYGLCKADVDEENDETAAPVEMAGKLINIELHTRRSQRVAQGLAH
ncbi:WAT1-related protein [Tanacetum coccineum]|uniref:WAT1-related protein n=1 Tax=Tanacetum coccineum TaxID=301880 RepID=A0ABQ4ZVD4_9ASTR